MNNKTADEGQTGSDTIHTGAAILGVEEKDNIRDESLPADTADAAAVSAPADSDTLYGSGSADGPVSEDPGEAGYVSEGSSPDGEGAEDTDLAAGEEPDTEQESGKEPDADQEAAEESDAEQETGEEPDSDRETGEESDAEQETGGESDTEQEAGEGSDAEQGSGDEPGAEQESEKEPEKDPEIEAIKQKIRERKREKRRRARLRKVRFWTVLSLMFITIGGLIFSLSGVFTVDSIEVRGNSHFTSEEIINIAHAVPGHNLIYNPGKKSITDYLEQNPYIKSAEVTRKLPSTLVITVNERKQACAFKYDDDYLVMDDEGILLKKTRTEPKLTIVKGLVVTKIRLGDTVGTENQQMFSKLLRLIRAMESNDLYFVRVDMSSYSEDHIVRAYVYEKLIVKSDYDALLTNINNGRLHRVLEKLFDEGTKRGTISFDTDGSASFEPGI